MGKCLLVFKFKALDEPGGYPIAFGVGVIRRENWHRGFPGAMQAKFTSFWGLHCLMAILLKSKGHEQSTP